MSDPNHSRKGRELELRTTVSLAFERCVIW